jgi:SnoaL-like domain
MWLDTLTASDRVNLLELYARSVMLLELGRCKDWADLFQPDALVRCASPADDASSERFGVSRQFRGRAELLELARRIIDGEFDLALGPLNPSVRCRHTLSNVSLFGEGTARASGYAHLTVTSVGGAAAPCGLASGMYSDALRKCGAGCWQFESRALMANGVAVLEATQPAAAPRTAATV